MKETHRGKMRSVKCAKPNREKGMKLKGATFNKSKKTAMK